MRWSEEELNKAIEMLQNGDNFEIIAENLNRSKKSIKEKLNKLGYKQSDFVSKEYYHEQKCEYCDNLFTSLISENRKFCSKSCSASFNNKLHIKRVKENNFNGKCANCDCEKNNKRYKYCSHSCQHEFKRKEIFKKIENGDTTLFHRNYKKYLIHIHGEKCMKCGWGVKNKFSDKIPIEMEHIDGNSENNNLDNLELLCPNCHSLTSTYKGLNKGNGRYIRMERYNDGKSY